MEPRLSQSAKWSPLPNELLLQVQSVFKESFAKEIGTGKIIARGKIFPEEILVSVGYRPDKSMKQSNFMISIAYKKNKDNVLKLLHLAVDAQAALFEQFFAAENDHEFPRLWEEVDFEGRKIFIQYDTTNDELENQANKFLGRKGETDEVAQGDWDEDLDPEIIKHQLGLNDDDDGGTEH